MKTRNILVIFLSSVLLIFSCATNQQNDSSPELLGTWIYKVETPDGHYVEQAFTFDENGNSIMETRQYGYFTFGGNKFKFLRPQDIHVIKLYSFSKKGRLYLNDFEYFFYKIDKGYLIFSGITNKLFNQSIAKYEKISDTEVENWNNEKEIYLRTGKNLNQW